MESIPSGHNFSKVVNTIIWSRQLNGKVRKIVSMSQTILGDLEEFEKFKDFTENLLNAIKDFENDQFEKWRQEIMNILKQPNNELSLQMSGRLMELDMQD